MLKGSETYLLTEELGKDIVKESRRLLSARNINTTGTLSRSIGYNIEQDGISFEMESYGVLRDSGQLGKKRKILKRWSDSIFIRGKGFTNKRPPVEPLNKWIQAKGISNAPGLAFMISRKIYFEGIQPGLFFSDAYNKFAPVYFQKVDNAVSKDLDKIIDNDSK
jgi:hypothetical protein